MTCDGVCPREAVQQDAVSPGPIGDQEKISRAVSDPMSGNKNRLSVKRAIVERRALLNDQLSVWRLAGDEPRITIGEMSEFLRNKDQSRDYFAIVWAPARDIRAICQLDTRLRALCVVDECECDPAGGKHPAHAHIGLCKNVDQKYRDAQSPEFEQLVQDLAALLSNKDRFWLMY